MFTNLMYHIFPRSASKKCTESDFFVIFGKMQEKTSQTLFLWLDLKAASTNYILKRSQFKEDTR